MTKCRTFCVIVFVLAATFFVTPLEAQSVPSLDKIQNQEELDRAGAALDAALFDSYNKCDLEKFASFFVDDVEFYHDQGGLTLGKTALTDSVKKNICGKTTRELVSLKVFCMKGYGMLETGVHRFHHPGHEDTEGVGEGSLFTCGNTRMGPGRSRAPSATITTLPGSKDSRSHMPASAHAIVQPVQSGFGGFLPGGANRSSLPSVCV